MRVFRDEGLGVGFWVQEHYCGLILGLANKELGLSVSRRPCQVAPLRDPSKRTYDDCFFQAGMKLR